MQTGRLVGGADQTVYLILEGIKSSEMFTK